LTNPKVIQNILTIMAHGPRVWSLPLLCRRDVHQPHEGDNDSDSGEEDEAENDVIEQLSHRIGTLKIAGDHKMVLQGLINRLTNPKVIQNILTIMAHGPRVWSLPLLSTKRCT
jgi:NAD-dependent oxidoreductase involved in siderophore biosynthesis